MLDYWWKKLYTNRLCSINRLTENIFIPSIIWHVTVSTICVFVLVFFWFLFF